MNAKYFYKRLCNYENESRKTGNYYYGYCNRIVYIHRKGDNINYYCVDITGDVYHYSINRMGILNTLRIENLTGNDFELFNPVQILKSGYIKLKDTTCENDVKSVITLLHDYIESFEDPFCDMPRNEIPLLCGGCVFSYDGLTDGISFYTTNGVEIDIYTIRRLVEKNMYRKYYDAKVFPFNKRMDDDNSFYVTFSYDVSDTNRSCKDALTELRKYLDELNIRYEWIDMYINYPVYK